MKDEALALLIKALREERRPAWWLADEHLAGMALPGATIPHLCLSNRIDVARQLEAAGYRALCNDFDFNALSTGPPAAVYFRVSKEKALAHYLLDEALSRLPPGGELYLSGFKGDGIRGYIDRAREQVGGERRIQRGPAGANLGCVIKRREPQERLDREGYTQLRNIAPPGERELFSKPGIFGWQKIDRGSALLVRQLPDFLARFERPPRRLLDLGCGYGYLTVMASALHPARYIATDNNAAAVTACRRNFTEHAIEGSVVLADCAEGIEESGDAVLCNPPFHRGFDIRGDLTERFLQAAHRLLRPGGRSLFVVNQFIALEKKAEGVFASVNTVAEDGGYKVVEMVR